VRPDQVDVVLASIGEDIAIESVRLPLLLVLCRAQGLWLALAQQTVRLCIRARMS
jgi:hypothetical protein